MGGNATGVSSSSPEPEIEARPARNAVVYRDASAMRSDDLHNDRQAEAGSAATYSVPTPEALKDVRPVLRRDAGAAILDTDRPPWINLDNHFGPRGCMRERIFNKIAQRVGDGGSVTSDQDRVVGAGQRDCPAGR